jgi:apolipoprotein D and lipocalin family protein
VAKPASVLPIMTTSSFAPADTLRRLTLAVALFAPLAAPAQARAPLQTIDRLGVGRYMGSWYEIAKYPNWLQRQLDDSQLDVINRCRQANGDMTEAVGRDRQTGPADSPKQEVRFARAWLSWLPMVWGHHWVIDLDPDYQPVAASEPKREHLWILWRTPRVETEAYQTLLGRWREKESEIRI